MIASEAKGARAGVASGHPLATEAALEVLAAGGNAVDAGVAGGIMLGVVHSDLVNFAGVAPMIIKPANGPVTSIDGLGVWPRKATAAFFAEHFGGAIPEGILRTVVPAAPAAWVKALRDHGTMRFGEVAAAAIRTARGGFEVFPLLAEFIANNADRYARWPATAAVYLPGGRAPKAGERFFQRDLANTIEAMALAEARASGSREAGLDSAHNAFYQGDVAAIIADYHRANGGFLTKADLAGFNVRVQAPLHAAYRGHDLYTCGSWCQGVSLAQALMMLDRAYALPAQGQDDPAYVHALVELLKLVFADRDAYVADPAFCEPAETRLLDPAFIAERIAQIDPTCATPGMPPPGGSRPSRSPEVMSADPRAGSADTSHISVIDAEGTMFAATPSDTSADTEVIPGLGICPSSRGSQSMGIPGHINAVAPGKRPRLTPNAALGLKDGRPWITFGTPGGDVQIQAMVQMLENRLRFGMKLGDAITTPRFASFSFPNSFAPNEYLPGRLMVERALDASIGCDLRALGHDVQVWEGLHWKAGGLCAVEVVEDGQRHAVTDPRRAGQAGAL